MFLLLLKSKLFQWVYACWSRRSQLYDSDSKQFLKYLIINRYVFEWNRRFCSLISVDGNNFGGCPLCVSNQKKELISNYLSECFQKGKRSSFPVTTRLRSINISLKQKSKTDKRVIFTSLHRTAYYQQVMPNLTIYILSNWNLRYTYLITESISRRHIGLLVVQERYVC